MQRRTSSFAASSGTGPEARTARHVTLACRRVSFIRHLTPTDSSFSENSVHTPSPAYDAPFARIGTQDDGGDAGLDDIYHIGDGIFVPAEDDDAPSDRAPRRPPPDPWTDGGVHDRLVENFLGSAATRSKRTLAALRGKADTIEQWAATFTCPCCRGVVKAAGEHSSGRCIVTLVGLEAALNVHISIGVCSVCKKTGHVSPTDVGYFPSTLKQALDLTTVPWRSVPPIWFSTQLLDMILGLQVCAFLECDTRGLC